MSISLYNPEELELIKMFWKRGAKFASRDDESNSIITFWRQKPCKENFVRWYGDDLISTISDNIVTFIKPGELINLDVLFGQDCKERCGVADETEKKDSFDSDDDLMLAAILMMLFAGIPSNTSDYYRGKYDGLAEYMDKLRKEDADGGD